MEVALLLYKRLPELSTYRECCFTLGKLGCEEPIGVKVEARRT